MYFIYFLSLVNSISLLFKLIKVFVLYLLISSKSLLNSSDSYLFKNIIHSFVFISPNKKDIPATIYECENKMINKMMKLIEEGKFFIACFDSLKLI